MGIWIRNAIYAAALLVASPWLLFRSLRTGRYRSGLTTKLLGLRRTSASPDRTDALDCIWLHGVSVGEVLLLGPLVNQLRSRHPGAQLAVSTTTETGMEVAKRIMPNDVHVFYFPLDFSWAVRRTLASLRPSLVVLGELELWPNLMEICHRRRIPVAVANGRLSERSFRGYQRLLTLVRPMFAKLSCVCAQTEQYAQRFEQCGVSASKTVVTGSIKFDNVRFDRQATAVQELRSLCGVSAQHTVFLAGSTQVEEEQAALEAFLAFRKEHPDLRLILVPRHPDRFDQVAQQIEASPVRWRRRSALTEPISADDWEVLLVDTVGELSSWWGTADHALIGGTFGCRGGQNMIEPAAFGCNVAFGPQTSNFRDTVQLLLDADAAVRLRDTADVTTWLRGSLDDVAPGHLRGQNAVRLVRQQQGAMQATLQQLDRFLADPKTNQTKRPAA